jgi:hypothetical protein
LLGGNVQVCESSVADREPSLGASSGPTPQLGGVIEFSDGMHEYVTTPVKRVLRVAAKDVFYIETVNSRYRLEVRDRERALEDASSG